MTSEGNDQPRGFKVEDRRRFSESGQARAQEEPPESGGDPEASRAADAAFTMSKSGNESVPPEITFYTFVISLSTQALAHLGEMPHPVDGSTAIDLAAAGQIIDILGMLREKTRANLDPEEQRLLEHALYDLRMKYVERVRKGQP